MNKMSNILLWMLGKFLKHKRIHQKYQAFWLEM